VTVTRSKIRRRASLAQIIRSHEGLTATEAARGFFEILNAVERRGETFVVARDGRPVALVGPVRAGQGAAVKNALRAHPRDAGWADELRALRAGLSVERWTA
jgi:antitoxin (DNA-binding transcriptional repressor) of toxin-antitoxin stability system